jgi:hypothetical protein
MKIILFIVICISSLNAHANTCLEKYIEKRDQGLMNKISEASTITSASGVVIGVIAGSSAMMMVGLPVLAISGGVMLTQEARYNRVIDLLKDARDHSKTGGALSPGPDLLKFYKKLKNDELTIMEVAQMLTQSSEDLSLCSRNQLKFYRKLKRQYQASLLSL